MNRAAERLPYVFLAVSNPYQDLPGIETESGAILSALEIARAAGLIAGVIGPPRTLTLEELIRPFRDPNYRGRIAIFHYAGHGSPFQLLLEGPTSAGQPAYAGGFAQFLSTQFSLKLVFLNACFTGPQVEALLRLAGVDVVIATSQRIRDDVAREFAAEFYQALAKDVTVREAFEQAAGVVQTEFGDGYRELIRPEFLPTPGAAEPGNSASLRALVWGKEIGETTTEGRVLPWALVPREEYPDSAAWKLSELKEDPTYGLPPLPKLDFPAEPYPGFRRFTRSNARAFFGRWRYIREIYEDITSPDTTPILLIFGTSGVGKSSLLDAGLVPRLECVVKPIPKRLDEQSGSISEVWQSALQAIPDQSLLEAWKGREAEEKKTMVVVLDQLEEIFQHRAGGPTHAPEEFARDLKNIFGNPADRPAGKLILSFTKDYLAEVKQLLRDAGLEGAASEWFLQTLSRADVIEAIRLSPNSRRHYRLEIEDGLAELIADQLTKEPGLIVAPTVQILLAEMWERATHASQDGRSFSRDLFRRVEAKGYRLPEFLNQQMRKIESWDKSVVESGLLLDLLAAHTGPGGRASECNLANLREDYSNQGSTLDGLIAQCKTAYLLVDPASLPHDSGQRLRLAHDTLAPLVRELYEASPAPGPQARRILEARVVKSQRDDSWPPLGAPDPTVKEKTHNQPPLNKPNERVAEKLHTPPLLSDADLAIVEEGKKGMRDWKKDEIRLVKVSREHRQARRCQRRALWVGGVAALALIVTGGILAVVQWRRAESQAHAYELQLNVNLIALADQDYRSFRFTESSLRLDSIPERARNWEWNYCQRRLNRDVCHFTLRSGEILKFRLDPVLGFTQDAHKLVVVDGEPTIYVWDLRLGKMSWTYVPLFHSGLEAITIDPRGTRVAFGYADGAIKLYDVEHHRLSGPPLTFGGKVAALSFSADGHFLATAGDRLSPIVVWDLRQPKPLLSINAHNLEVHALAFSPHGNLLAASGLCYDGPLGDDAAAHKATTSIKVWPLQHPESLQNRIDNINGEVAQMLFSSDGHRIVIALVRGEVAIYEAETRRLLIMTPATGVRQIATDPTDDRLAIAGPGRGLLVYERGKWLHDLLTRESAAVAYSSDGRQIATAGESGNVKIWDSTIFNEYAYARLCDNSDCVTNTSADGSYLAAGDSDGVLRVYTGDKLQRIAQCVGHKGRIGSLSFASDNTTLVSGGTDGTARIWDIATGHERVVLHGHDKEVIHVSSLRNNRWYLTATLSGIIRLWHDGGHTLGTEFDANCKGQLMGVASNVDGSRILTQDDSEMATLWDTSAPSGPRKLAEYQLSDPGFKGVQELPATNRAQQLMRPEWKAVFTISGRLIMTVLGRLTIVDAATGQIEYSLSGSHHRGVWFDLAGNVLVWNEDHRFELLALVTGERRSVGDTQDDVGEFSLQSDGTRLGYRSGNQVKIWDVETGNLVLSIPCSLLKESRVSLRLSAKCGNLLCASGTFALSF